MLPLLLKTHTWEANILNRLAWCLRKGHAAPAPCRLSEFTCLLQEQHTGSRNAISWLRTGEKQAIRAETRGEQWWVCNVCGSRWLGDEQDGLRDAGEREQKEGGKQ